MPLNDAKAKPSSFIICLLTALGYLQQSDLFLHALYTNSAHSKQRVCKNCTINSKLNVMYTTQYIKVNGLKFENGRC